MVVRCRAGLADGRRVPAGGVRASEHENAVPQRGRRGCAKGALVQAPDGQRDGDQPPEQEEEGSGDGGEYGESGHVYLRAVLRPAAPRGSPICAPSGWASRMPRTDGLFLRYDCNQGAILLGSTRFTRSSDQSEPSRSSQPQGWRGRVIPRTHGYKPDGARYSNELTHPGGWDRWEVTWYGPSADVPADRR